MKFTCRVCPGVGMPMIKRKGSKMIYSGSVRWGSANTTACLRVPVC